jgi:hypothetical protein
LSGAPSSRQGWRALVEGAPWPGPDGCPIDAYSEFMPPPRLGRKAYGELDPLLFAEDDPWGWHVTEYEEGLELRPGLEHLAAELLKTLRHLGRNEPAHGISRNKLRGNPYWPEALQRQGAPAGERYLLLLPLALSRTQDDKGRVRWTLFGGSEQGPGRAFWQSFFAAPGRELPAAEGEGMLARLLASAWPERAASAQAAGPPAATPGSAGPPAASPTAAGSPPADLHAAGLRILPASPGEGDPAFPGWGEEPLPSWTRRLLWRPGEELGGVRYLLTFRPFAGLPEAVQQAYLRDDLALLPFPGSLVFWGARDYAELSRQLPFARQIPLLQAVERSEALHRLRVPQAGWLKEPRPGAAGAGAPDPARGPLRNTFRRTHRWARIARTDDELAVSGSEDKVAHVLFSADPEDLGLYGKPMARNAQLWTAGHELLLDGPRASRPQLAHAARQLAAGGLFGYRFHYPAMRVGAHEVYWQRPLVAHLGSDGAPAVPDGAPLGYLTAYRVPGATVPGAALAEAEAAGGDGGEGGRDRREKGGTNGKPPRGLPAPLELWPRLLDRPEHQAAVRLARGRLGETHRPPTANARKILDTCRVLGERAIERSFARALLTLPRAGSIEDWLAALPAQPGDGAAARELAAALRARLAADVEPAAAVPLTFGATARRSFEAAYWRLISGLATGRFVNKDNADCVLDPITQEHLSHFGRDLELLGDFLLGYYDRLIERAGMSGRARAAELPFTWRTDFDFSWSGGWLRNQQGETEERDLVVVIPGRDRRRAVIMADHYDTAYMEDVYGYGHGGGGPRLAAAGADDNHSATAALMLAAPVFLEMSRAGKLATDVWLVHLTGEEFPADCLGARHLTRCLVERNLRLRRGGRAQDRSRTEVAGVYVLDMVAHNNDRVHDVFQICPGSGRDSMRLAYHAHLANRMWNAAAPVWNRRHRRRRRRGRRSKDGKTMPATALHPQLLGEVRPHYAPHSTLYNTDGQIFSDAGVPVVLFMENYDINRHGYHDSHDTMENIDLDYGAAVAAIAIEAVARVATDAPLPHRLAPAAEGVGR